MPAFFILSGFLFNQRKAFETPLNQIKSKFYRLIIPAWILGLVCGIPFAALLLLNIGGISPEIFLQKLIGTLVGYPKVSYNFECTPIWFLFAVFIVEAIAITAYRMLNNFALPALYAIGCIGVILSTQVNSYTPFNLAISLTATFFFSIGLSIRKSNFKIQKSLDKAILAAICVPLILITTKYTPATISMAENFIAKPKWFLANTICALAGTYSLYFLASALKNPFIAWIGTKTIPILAFNYFANTASRKALSLVNIDHWTLIFLTQSIGLIILVYLAEKSATVDQAINGQWMFKKTTSPTAHNQ